LKLLENLSAQTRHNDYYLILEDDVIFDIERFVRALMLYLEVDIGHWYMLIFDTFDMRGGGPEQNRRFVFSAPEEDRIHGPLDLYVFSSSWGYWGAHAWLVHDTRVGQLLDHMRSTPTMPLDWYPKWPSQLHATFISYQSGSVWQRKYAPKDELIPACAYRVSSDILDGASPRSRNLKSSQGEVIILGTYNSGTNLLQKLMHANFEKPLNIELCKNYSGWGYCGRVWKHTHPRRLSEAISLRPDYGDFNQTIAIVIVRHPFAFVHSLRTGENYDTRCGKTVEQECNYVSPTGKELKQQMGNKRIQFPICPVLQKLGRPCWPNVAEGWNSYVDGYLHDIGRLFKQVEIIRYEDLVQDPERTLSYLRQYIAPDSGLQWDWRPLAGRSKRLGGNRSDALQKLTKNNYGVDFTENQLKVLCKQLNKSLMGRLGYHGCTPDWGIDFPVRATR
jgi:hypothetical protein